MTKQELVQKIAQEKMMRIETRLLMESMEKVREDYNQSQTERIYEELMAKLKHD
jgi:hypothetical protein